MKKRAVSAATMIFAAFFALVCLAGCSNCSGCSSCNGEYSETFVGAVSAETYESSEDAVKGFLETEISGKTVEAVFVDYKKETELNEKEVKELPIDEEYRDGLLSVERGKVEYAEKSVSTARVAPLSDSLEKVTYIREVFILTYTDMFRFFVPEQKEGETLSMSYYDSVFEGEKYINCTMNASITNEYTAGGIKYTVKNDAYCKATENSVYELDNAEVISGGVTQSTTVESYAFDDIVPLYSTQKGLVDYETIFAAQKIGTEDWSYAYDVYPYPDPEGNFVKQWESINEFFMKWFDERFGQLDHTFFEKTETGYALREDKYKDYLAIAYPDAPTEGFELEYTINIKDGRMADFAMRIAYKDFTATMSCVFSDFGKTELEIPEEIKKLAEKEKKELTEATKENA